MTQRQLVGGATHSFKSTRRQSMASELGSGFIPPEILDYKYLEKIEQDRKYSFSDLYKTPTEYINALSQRIPLSDLYEVKDCFCENAANEYCAVSLEVKNEELRKILQIKPDDRILKVYNKTGSLVYQRVLVPIAEEHLKTATNSKYRNYLKKVKNSTNKSSQDEERGIYPLVALYQNYLLIDPREDVPTGNEGETNQGILNLIRLDHKRGTKILKLRIQNTPLTESLDLFANVAYLDKHLMFLTEEYSGDKLVRQKLDLVKIDFEVIFEMEPANKEEDGSIELAQKGEETKNSVHSHEISTKDFIPGPILTNGHNYHSFFDIGYNELTINKETGDESSSIVEGVALIDEYKGKIAFIELQVKVVQKQGNPMSSKKSRSKSKQRSRSGSRGKSPRRELNNKLSYEGTGFEPKVLFCNLSTFQSYEQKSTARDQQIKKIVSRMFFTREEAEGKKLHHSALVLMETGEAYFYNEFSFVYAIEGKFADVFGDFDSLYLCEMWVGNSYKPIGDKPCSKPHVWEIPMVMSSKASDSIRPIKTEQLLVQPKTPRQDEHFPEVLVANKDNRDCLLKHLLQQTIRQWVKLIPDFCQLGEFFVVAHDRFVSVFSNQQWLFHEQFPDQVFFLTPIGQMSAKKYQKLADARKSDMETHKREHQGTEQSDEEQISDYDDEESEDYTQTEDGEESAEAEYDESETIFMFRILYGLGKCADLAFPRSVNRSDYRQSNKPQQQQLDLSYNKMLPFRIFQARSHPNISGYVFFLTDMDPFDQHQMFDLQYGKDIVGRAKEQPHDGKSKVSVAGTIMKAIREKEQFIKETFKNVNTRSEIFFKFTGYSYKLASAWKLTLSNQKPLLPFHDHYECVVLPKEPKKTARRFHLWMITKSGQYKRIQLNKDIELDITTTQLSLQYNSLNNRIILSLLTKKHYTNIDIYSKCRVCRQKPMTDYSYELSSNVDDEQMLRSIDFHRMQWVYRFQLLDEEFEEDLQTEQCDHKLEAEESEVEIEQLSRISERDEQDVDESNASVSRLRDKSDGVSPQPDIQINSATSILEQDQDEADYLHVPNAAELAEVASEEAWRSKKQKEDDEYRKLRREYTVRSQCLNQGREKEKYDDINMALKLHFIFVLDGRIILARFDCHNGTHHHHSKSRFIDGDVRLYNTLKVVRKCISMNIREAIDSCDEQDFIYCLTDGFEVTKQEDMDNKEEKASVQQDDILSGAYMPPCLMTIDVRHFANMLEIDFQPVKPAIAGVNSKIILDGQQQATLIIDNFNDLGRQPTAHSDRIMFFSFPEFQRGEYEMLIDRQSQEHFEIVTNKNEIYQWEVMTGRLLRVTTDKNLNLKDMKISKNSAQHFSEFSLSVVVKDTAAEVLQYEEKSGYQEMHDKMNDEQYYMIPIEKENARQQKKLTMKEREQMRKAKLIQVPQKRIYCLKLQDKRVPESKQFKRLDHKGQPNYSRVSLEFWFDYFILDDTVGVQGLRDCSTSKSKEKLKQDKQSEEAPIIKFTEDLQKMLCITNNGSVFIFKQKGLKIPEEDEDDQTPEVEWSVYSVINDIHSSILQRSKELFLFDPTFEYYFNIQFNMDSFVIFHVLDMRQKGRASEVYKQIDTKWFNIKLRGNKSFQNISRLVSRMQMLDSQRIRIVNSQGLDTVYNYMEEQCESFYPVEDFEIQYGTFKDPNMIVEPLQRKRNQTTLRLIDTNHEYRRHVQFMKQLDKQTFTDLFQRQSNTLLDRLPANRLDYERLERNMKIFEIERYYNPRKRQFEPFVQQSFTLLDWIAMNEISKNSTSNNHELMSEQSIIRMVYNLLPTNRSFLEMLVLGKNNQKVELIRHFFHVCNRKDYSVVLHGLQPQLPLIRNLEGKTALDYTLQQEPVYIEERKSYENCFDPILAGELFMGMSRYEPFSIREVATAIPRAVEYDLPCLAQFLDLRMKKYHLFESKHWKMNYFYKNQSSLLFTQKKDKQSDQTYVTSNCFSAWPSKRHVAQKIFLFNSRDIQAYSEVDFRLLDIPDLHNAESPIGEDFVAQLRNTNSSSLFSSYAVSSIIQERFQRSQRYFNSFLMWPFFAYLLILNFWLHFVYVQDAHAMVNPIVLGPITTQRTLIAEGPNDMWTDTFIRRQLEDILFEPSVVQPPGIAHTVNSTQPDHEVLLPVDHAITNFTTLNDSQTPVSGPIDDTDDALTNSTTPVDSDLPATPDVEPILSPAGKASRCTINDQLKFHQLFNECGPAKAALMALEYLMILMAFYFFVSSLIILLVPLFKGYSSIGKTLSKNQLYFDLLPNLIVMAVFVLAKMNAFGVQKVVQLETNQQFKLRRRQALGVANFILWTRMLFNLKTSKLMGFNLMVVQNILYSIPVFFCVFFIMIYVFSDFIWIGSNKYDTAWTTAGGNGASFFSSGWNSFQRMMTLSLFGNTEWLTIQYGEDGNESIGMSIYYLVVWCTFTIINNTVMYNLLVGVLTVSFSQFITKEQETLKLTQTETIQDLTPFEKAVLAVRRCFNKHAKFHLRKEYLYVAFYSHTYVVKDRLPIKEKERFQNLEEDMEEEADAADDGKE